MLNSRSCNTFEGQVDVHSVVDMAHWGFPQIKNHHLPPLLGQLKELLKGGQALLRKDIQLATS